MTEPVHSDIADAPPDASPGTSALITSLRTAGAARFDRVRWRYLEVLAERAAAHQGKVKGMLEVKLMQGLAAFKEHFDEARCEARDILTQSLQRYPHAAGNLQQLFDAGDFKALQRLIANLKTGALRASLSALVRQLEQHSSEHAAAPAEGIVKPSSELKTIRNFRNTWSKLSVDKQVVQALAQAPKNAGPINSHMLVLRSLALMRELSPDYLNRFMSYADTLLCLEQGEREKLDKPKKRSVSKAAKKS